jgi:hypothetical protein
MNRLMQRLAYLESRLISEGRMIVVFEDVHLKAPRPGLIAVSPRWADRPRT